MYLFNTAIISGNRDFLIKRLLEDGGVPLKRAKVLKKAPIETLVKLCAELLDYESGIIIPDKSQVIKICFIRCFGALIQVLISIPGQPDFSCYGMLDTFDYLKNQGIEIESKHEQMLTGFYEMAAFAYELGILNPSH